MSIGNRIRSRRHELGLTQEVFAGLCVVPRGLKSVSQGDVSRWESGQEPRASLIASLADALGVPVRWLLTGESSESTGPSEAA